MNWVFFSLATAVLQAFKDVLLKRALPSLNPILALWAYCLPATILLWLVVLPQGVPPLGPGFWSALFWSVGTGVISFYLYVAALEASDLSLTLPMLTFTPIFMLITSPLMVGEFPDLGGCLGIVLIVTGAYVLNLAQRRKGLFAPFKALFSQRGPKLMLAVSLLWSITGNLDRLGLNNSAPLFWSASVFSGLILVLFPVIVWQTKGRIWRLYARPLDILGAGIFEGLSMICQMTALTMAIVPYVIALKRFNVMVGVALGALVFKEKGFRERLAGSILMLLGVFFIAVLG